MFDLPKYADIKAIKSFLAAWDGWRKESAVPCRSNVDLGQIKTHLAYTMLFDMVSKEEIQCRYMGSIFLNFYGQDYTGQNYLELTAPKDRAVRAERLFGIVDQPCAAVWGTLSTGWRDGPDYLAGVSVPIWPDAPGKPQQLMQFFTPLEGMHIPRFEKKFEKRNVALSNQFQFLDIGAGIPA
jgi:hypothetical protein